MQVISQEWEESRCSALPLELWEQIIAEITDFQYHPRAWLYIRRVSHLLKDATEHVFMTKHLTYSRLEFKPLILREASLARYPEVVEIPLAFDRLSDDRTRAIFASEKGFDKYKDMPVSSHVNGATETVYDRLMQWWRSLTRQYTQQSQSVEDVCFPAHCLVLYGEVDDTELPGIEFDVDRLTVSVPWRSMFSIFYGEVEYRKWATKIIQQHATLMGDELQVMDAAGPVCSVPDQSDHRLLRKRSSAVMAKVEEKEAIITCKIRTIRFKRILKKMEYREKKEDIPDGFFKLAGRASFVESVKYALCWARDEDKDTQEDGERGLGCFYDGMGMTFDGKSELNEPGVISDDDDEWEDDDDGSGE